MSRRTKKPKREFSKLILYVVGAVTVGVTAFTLIMIWRTENLEPLAYLIPRRIHRIGNRNRVLLFQSQGRKPD